MTKEDILFELFKDSVETGTELKRSALQKKYPDVNIPNLHIRIVNYQVKKYGCSLNTQKANLQDNKVKSINAKNRRRQRLGK